jgi:hypothetical protein
MLLTVRLMLRTAMEAILKQDYSSGNGRIIYEHLSLKSTAATSQRLKFIAHGGVTYTQEWEA